jgi:hypothetical protein
MRRKPTGGETAKKIDKRQEFDESVFLLNQCIAP